jgi:hypothetical protein
MLLVGIRRLHTLLMLVGLVEAPGISSAPGLLAISATVARRYDKPGAAWFGSSRMHPPQSAHWEGVDPIIE